MAVLPKPIHKIHKMIMISGIGAVGMHLEKDMTLFAVGIEGMVQFMKEVVIEKQVPQDHGFPSPYPIIHIGTEPLGGISPVVGPIGQLPIIDGGNLVGLVVHGQSGEAEQKEK